MNFISNFTDQLAADSPIPRAIKIAADLAALPNQGQRFLMELMDPQNLNNFEVLFYPKALLTAFNYANLEIVSNVITRVAIKSITFGFPEFKYESAGPIKYVADITYPETVTMVLIENELALVRNFVQLLQSQIAIPSAPIFPFGKSLNTGLTSYSDMGYTFRDNQNAARRDALIFMNTGLAVPSPGAVRLENLRYMGHNEITLSQDSQEYMALEVRFAVENSVWVGFTTQNLI